MFLDHDDVGFGGQREIAGMYSRIRKQLVKLDAMASAMFV